MNSLYKVVFLCALLPACGSALEAAPTDTLAISDPEAAVEAAAEAAVPERDSGTIEAAAEAGVSSPEASVEAAQTDAQPEAAADVLIADAAAEADALEAASADAAADANPATSGCAVGATIIPMFVRPSAVVFGTGNAVCFTYPGAVDGWAPNDCNGRIVTVTGATTQTLIVTNGADQPGMEPGPNGYIYWNFSAGSDQGAMGIF